jgi:hypothetical protein
VVPVERGASAEDYPRRVAPDVINAGATGGLVSPGHIGAAIRKRDGDRDINEITRIKDDVVASPRGRHMAAAVMGFGLPEGPPCGGATREVAARTDRRRGEDGGGAQRTGRKDNRVVARVRCRRGCRLVRRICGQFSRRCQLHQAQPERGRQTQPAQGEEEGPTQALREASGHGHLRLCEYAPGGREETEVKKALRIEQELNRCCASSEPTSHARRPRLYSRGPLFGPAGAATFPPINNPSVRALRPSGAHGRSVGG